MAWNGLATKPTCSENCDRTAVGRGYCQTHYTQWSRNGFTWPIGTPKPRPPMPPCSLRNCDTPQRRGKTGLCQHHARWNMQHLRDYGIDLFERERLIEAQDGRCAGCHRVTELHLDHVHGTGRVRGMLCGNRNRALGLIADDPDTLRALLAYVKGGSPS
jgi:hypothetical protein